MNTEVLEGSPQSIVIHYEVINIITTGKNLVIISCEKNRPPKKLI
jgi:hypothetical protein